MESENINKYIKEYLKDHLKIDRDFYNIYLKLDDEIIDKTWVPAD